MSEAKKISAHYLNGIALAVLAIAGSAYLAGNVPLQAAALAGVLGAVLHQLAVAIVR
jgi:hypothetical protein